MFLHLQSYTRVRYTNGMFAKMTIVLSFLGLIGYGPLAFLALIPICFSVGAKWMKDIEHVNPETGEIVGTYYRGFQDAPSVYSYHQGSSSELTTEVQIEFGSVPVLLPDGVSTETWFTKPYLPQLQVNL